MYFDQGSRSLKTLVLTVFPKRAGSSWEVKLTRDFGPRALPGIQKLPKLAIYLCQNGSVIAKMLFLMSMGKQVVCQVNSSLDSKTPYPFHAVHSFTQPARDWCSFITFILWNHWLDLTNFISPACVKVWHYLELKTVILPWLRDSFP